MNKTLLKLKKRALKFNIIDLIGVVIFLICIGLIVFAFLRRTEYVNVTLRISNEKTYLPLWQNNPAEWYISNLQPGFGDKDFLGRTNLLVTDVHYYPVNGATQTVYITVKVRSVYNKTSGQYLYNGVPLLVGDLQNLKIKGVAIQGVVLTVNPEGVKPEKKAFIGKGILETQYNETIQYPANISYKGIRNYIADKIQPGLIIKDNNGNPFAQILEVKKSPGTEQFVSNGQLTSAVDPERQQVDLTVRFFTTQVNNKYLFREEEPLVLGHYYGLDFPGFTIVMTLTQFQAE